MYRRCTGSKNMDYLTLFLSLRCTNACAHCLYGCSPEYGEHMSWDVFARSIVIVEENKIHMLNFFGGEPLLNPQFFPMLQTTLEKNLYLILATNCRRFEKEELFTELLDKKFIYEAKGNVFIFSDVRFIKFHPSYIIRKLVERYHIQEISLNEYITHLKLLTEEFDNRPMDIDYEII